MSRIPLSFASLLLWSIALTGMAAPVSITLDTAASTRGIDERLTGKPPDVVHYSIFTAIDYDRGLTCRRNPDLWCVDLAVYLTCFSPWNSNEKAYQGGTLITPKHAIFAEHFSGRSGSNTLHAGDQIIFVDTNNIVYKRTLKATPVQVGSTDICVATFNEPDLPPSVVPAQVLPAGLTDRDIPPGTPVVFCNKNKWAMVAELISLTGVIIRPAVAPNRAPWTLGGPAFVGDSGSPIFALVDGRLVLLALFHAPNSGPAISANIDGINAVLGRGYALDVLKISKK